MDLYNSEILLCDGGGYRNLILVVRNKKDVTAVDGPLFMGETRPPGKIGWRKNKFKRYHRERLRRMGRKREAEKINKALYTT